MPRDSKGRFIKGFSYRKGKHLTPQQIIEMSKRLKGRKAWNKGLKGQTFGYHHSDETKEKIGRANSISQKGKKLSLETRRKMSLSKRGKNAYQWQGGKTRILKRLRNSLEYRLWRDAVYKRDDYTCVWCGKRGMTLNADHIKPFAYYPELRFAIDNGRTLCLDCHKTTDTYLKNQI